MKKKLLSASIIILISCSNFTQEKSLDWVKETENTEWKARDSQGEVVFKNKLWILEDGLIPMKHHRVMCGVHQMEKTGQ